MKVDLVDDGKRIVLLEDVIITAKLNRYIQHDFIVSSGFSSGYFDLQDITILDVGLRLLGIHLSLPAVLHAYIYKQHNVVTSEKTVTITKDEADKLFFDSMTNYNVPWLKKWLAYLLVGFLGDKTWAKIYEV